MAIGIVSSDEFEKELIDLGIISDDSNSNDSENDDNIRAEITSIDRGRGANNLEVPDSLRKVLGEDAIVNGNASANELARALDISPSSVSAYKNGATSTTTYHEGDKDLKEHTNKVREKIATKARGRLLMAMNSITKEKLEGAKLRDVASVASAMSNVIRNMEPEKEAGNNQNQFIFYMPKVRDEKSFEVIDVKE